MSNSKRTSNITLNQKMAAIGFKLGFSEAEIKFKGQHLLTAADLEETLIRTCYEAQSDYRVLSVLSSWITIHADYVIVEKFEKKRIEFEKVLGLNRITDLISAQAVISGSHKWKRLIRTKADSPEIPINPEELRSSIEFHGLNPDLAAFGIHIPKKMLRLREGDVMAISDLAKWNLQYRSRLLYGASWRADLVFAIEAGVENPNRAAKLLGCSYEPAYRVFKDYRMAHGEAA